MKMASRMNLNEAFAVMSKLETEPETEVEIDLE